MDTVKPPEVDPPEPGEDQDDLDEMPRVQVTRKGLVLFGFFVVSAIAFLYFVLPQLTDLENTGRQVGEGNRWWLAGACVFSVRQVLCQHVEQPRTETVEAARAAS